MCVCHCSLYFKSQSCVVLLASGATSDQLGEIDRMATEIASMKSRHLTFQHEYSTCTREALLLLSLHAARHIITCCSVVLLAVYHIVLVFIPSCCALRATHCVCSQGTKRAHAGNVVCHMFCLRLRGNVCMYYNIFGCMCIPSCVRVCACACVCACTDRCACVCTDGCACVCTGGCACACAWIRVYIYRWMCVCMLRLHAVVFVTIYFRVNVLRALLRVPPCHSVRFTAFAMTTSFSVGSWKRSRTRHPPCRQQQLV